jgi:hypothetical protein
MTTINRREIVKTESDPLTLTLPQDWGRVRVRGLPCPFNYATLPSKLAFFTVGAAFQPRGSRLKASPTKNMLAGR